MMFRLYIAGVQGSALIYRVGQLAFSALEVYNHHGKVGTWLKAVTTGGLDGVREEERPKAIF